MNKAGSYRFHAKSDRAYFKIRKKGKTNENSQRLYVVFFKIVCRIVKSKTYLKSSRQDEYKCINVKSFV